MKGKFTVIEGIDGSGKGTIIHSLKQWLTEQNVGFYLTNEPSSKGLRPVIKKMIASGSINNGVFDALLFAADRVYHVSSEIDPELKKGKHVICDRYYHSTFAYQNAQGEDLEWLMEVNKYARTPDLTLILDIPADVAVRRITFSDRNSQDRYEKIDFLNKVRKLYLKMPELLKDEDILIIDADRSPSTVFEDVKEIFYKKILKA